MHEFQLQNLRSLCKTIKTHMYTSVREVISLIHMAEDYYNSKKGTDEEGLIPALLFLFDTGYGTCVTGWGPMYENYCKTKQLGVYTSRNVRPRSPEEADYAKSRLHIIPFDYAFRFIKKDISEHE